MDPSKLILRHVEDIDIIWYGDPDPDEEAGELEPGWLLDNVELEHNNPFLADFVTDSSYNDEGEKVTTTRRVERTDEFIQAWAAGLIEAEHSYRVTGWTEELGGEWKPTMLELHHTLSITYGSGENDYVSHEFGIEQWQAIQVIDKVTKGEGMILLVQAPQVYSGLRHERTTRIPASKVLCLHHTVTEHAIGGVL